MGKVKSDETALTRQWKLLRILSGRHLGVTVKELAEEMGVGEKTIRRDLQTFSSVGFLLDESIGEFGRKHYRLRAAKEHIELSFPLDQALALYLGRRFLDPLAGTHLWEAAQNAFSKIRACVSKHTLDYLNKMSQVIHHRVAGVNNYAPKAELIDRLLQGIEDRRHTHLSYQSLQATEPVTYAVYPYGLAYFKGALYLVAHAPEHDEVRHYKVDRISDVALDELRFNRPSDFNLEQHLNRSFGIFKGGDNVRVRVRFHSSVARFVAESQWHPSQQLTTGRDGSVVAEFQLSSTEEIGRWVLGFGKHAEVLEPASLRAALVDELETLLGVYQVANRNGADPRPRQRRGTPR